MPSSESAGVLVGITATGYGAYAARWIVSSVAWDCGDAAAIRMNFRLFEVEETGSLGRAYWYMVLPLHNFVFSGMLGGIAERGRRG